MAVSDTLIGTLFDGRYQVVRKLGAGGMANVYLAEDQELGRRVAIKILNDRHAGDEQFVERFRREAKNAAALSHPNIVAIYDRGEAEGTYYIAMEFLDGRSLKELIVQRGPAPVTVSEAYLGAEIDVPTLQGKSALKVPKGTASGALLRMRGLGVTGVNGRGRGDQVVRVVVSVPSKLTKRQEEILAEFAKIEQEQSGKKNFWEKFFGP